MSTDNMGGPTVGDEPRRGELKSQFEGVCLNLTSEHGKPLTMGVIPGTPAAAEWKRRQGLQMDAILDPTKSPEVEAIARGMQTEMKKPTTPLCPDNAINTRLVPR